MSCLVELISVASAQLADAFHLRVISEWIKLGKIRMVKQGVNDFVFRQNSLVGKLHC